MWSRHYNFFNPEDYGAPPFIYINIVRDPVERVISDFYYRRYPSCSVVTMCCTILCVRSGAYVVDRINNFPYYPLPDPDYLRQDFGSCVEAGEPECQFIEGEYLDGRKELGHRRQMSQFCGQEHFCGAFNSGRAMMVAMVWYHMSRMY